jgi:hypothetical protein
MKIDKSSDYGEDITTYVPHNQFSIENHNEYAFQDSHLLDRCLN